MHAGLQHATLGYYTEDIHKVTPGVHGDKLVKQIKATLGCKWICGYTCT